MSVILIICIIGVLSLSFPAYGYESNKLDIKQYSLIEEYQIDNSVKYNTLSPSNFEKRIVYENSTHDTIEKDEKGRVLSYKAPNDAYSSPSFFSKSLFHENQIPSILDYYLSNVIENYCEFQIERIDTIPTGYRVSLYRTISDGMADVIDVSLNQTGNLRWFIVNYCDLNFITEQQKQQLENQVTEYIQTNGQDFMEYQTDVMYYKKENELIGQYTIIYTYEDNTYWAETVSANIGC